MGKPARAPHDRAERSAERRHGAPVAGIDEAGRGPWAGPVAAAAVVLDRRRLPEGIEDSKTLSTPDREQLYAQILATARVGVGLSSVAEIDHHNILGATFLAMQRALESLGDRPAAVLVDGNRAPVLGCPVETIVRGDATSLSIAAASIIAKVTRDRVMCELALEHPGYGFERHKGYGTPEHAAAIARLGVCSAHRRSFRPIRLALDRRSGSA